LYCPWEDVVVVVGAVVGAVREDRVEFRPKYVHGICCLAV
jgi:hypothetical protein